MSRPVLSLWPYLWRMAFLPVYLASVLASGLMLLPVMWGCNLLLGVGLVAFLYACILASWPGRFIRVVRRFRTFTEGRFVLHYAPALEERYFFPILLQRYREEFEGVARHFDTRLRGRIVVYLFAEESDIARIFGPIYGGTALWFANAIVIADSSRMWEVTRHEFVHLFSFRWSQLAPPLLSEGLSVWLQGTYGGCAIHTVAQVAFRDPNLKLPLLLSHKFFFTDPQRWACYMLAGSFTGFLIRRYGWERYRQLYRRCNGWRFAAKFKKVFGITLEQAEEEWRRRHDRGKSRALGY